MLESLFNKVAYLYACNFVRKRLQHECFPVAKFLRKFNLKNASELTLSNDCLELCLWTAASKTILTHMPPLYLTPTICFELRFVSSVHH